MSANKETERLEPIDLMDLLWRFVRALRRLWPLPVLLGLILSGFFLFRAHRNYRPYYESTALFTVSSGYSADDIFSSSYYDNMAAQQLAEAFPHMLRTDLMQDLMKQDLGVSYINGTVSASCVANSNLFSLKVRSTSAEDARDILWAVIDCFPQVAVYMVDNPQVVIRNEPSLPASPCNTFTWQGPAVKGLTLGILLGLGLILLAALLSKTVTSADQLKALFNLPVLAVFPLVQIKKRRNAGPAVLALGHESLAEPLRGLNLQVQKLLGDQTRRVILVTSTLSGEGKTTVAANLALSLAGSGKRVVLLDADLRSQSVASRLGGPQSPHGLLDCLRSARIPVRENLVAVEGTNLCYLSGASATSLRYTVDHKALDRILAGLESEFDYVVMDSSPCAIVPDTAALGRHANCVLYVVKPDYARQSQIIDTVGSLYSHDVQVSGFVMNSVPISRGQYGYGYKYGYGYGYPYNYGYSQASKYRRKAREQNRT